MRMHSKNSKRYAEVNRLVWYKVLEDMLRQKMPYSVDTHITAAVCVHVDTGVNQPATDIDRPIRLLAKTEVAEGIDNGH